MLQSSKWLITPAGSSRSFCDSLQMPFWSLERWFQAKVHNIPVFLSSSSSNIFDLQLFWRGAVLQLPIECALRWWLYKHADRETNNLGSIPDFSLGMLSMWICHLVFATLNAFEHCSDGRVSCFQGPLNNLTSSTMCSHSVRAENSHLAPA